MNNRSACGLKQTGLPSLCLLIMLIACVIAQAQESLNQKQSEGADDEQQQAIQWKYLLASLANDARSLLPEKSRPYALAAVADAYWNLDREIARELFMAALDSAFSPKEGEKVDSSAINQVLATVTKRDVGLTKTLIEIIAKKQKLDGLDESSLSVARELLERDPARATKLAEAFVPAGLSSGAANSFIFQLAKQDIGLANEIYRVYLNRFAADPKLTLNQLISLAGYAFGYHEFYGLTVDMPTQLYGVSSRRIADLKLNPSLAGAFLDLAFRRTSETVERASQLTGAERDYLSTVSLFTIAYLLPEVVKYAPTTVPAWERLQQRATTGTTPAQHEQVGRYIRSVNESRARVRRVDDAPQLSAEQAAEEMLERAEKAPNSCQRDKELSKAALRLSSIKEFKRAVAIADRVSDLKQRDGVKQSLFYDMAVAARDAGEWTEMRERAKFVSTPELIAVLYIRAAEGAHGKDGLSGAELLREALKNTESISDPEVRAGLLLGAAAVQVKFDAFTGFEILRTAIKTVNQRTAKDQSRFSFLMKVSLACPGDDEWHGMRISLANADLYEVLPLFSAHNVEETLLIARNLEDASTKIRAIASVVKYITDEKLFKPKSKLPVANPGERRHDHETILSCHCADNQRVWNCSWMRTETCRIFAECSGDNACLCGVGSS